jgi:hypothetical protein
MLFLLDLEQQELYWPDIILFDAPTIPAKLALIALLLSGVISLKMLSNQKEGGAMMD